MLSDSGLILKIGWNDLMVANNHEVWKKAFNELQTKTKGRQCLAEENKIKQDQTKSLEESECRVILRRPY